MASLTLSLRIALLPLTLGACSFEASGLGSDSGDGGDSTTSVDSTTANPTTSGTSQGPTTVSSEATDSTTTNAVTDATSDPTTTTDPTLTTTTDPTLTTTDPSTTTDVPGVCGDGMVDPGEECDTGAMNADDQPCTLECKTNVCGDGKKALTEGCDDGNLVDGDGCSAACATEGCGDGVKQAMEACDDGNMVDNDACTNACTLPACGDKIVQMGEQCDDGAETAPCDADCSTASCGDGNLNKTAGEACDDNNNANTDACVACQPAKCGDGFVQANVEQCDDANMVDNDACTNACKVVGLRAFVSSTLYNGQLGGLAGADLKCQSLATTANLGGTWMAWLSDGAVGPSVRFITKNGPKAYIRIDGKIIANNWADLTSKNLLQAIDITEKNQAGGDTTRVWTNTKIDGTPNSGDKHCGIWLVANNGTNGFFGRRNAVDAKWSIDTEEGCGTTKHLYCFEQ
jgi:cysteine-rich repeat protein